MAWLISDDALRYRPERVLIAGTSGSGKSTLARRIAAILDLPRRVVMTRMVRRTLGRRLRRTELWNGNREPPLRTIVHDRNHIIGWAWRTHAEHLPRETKCVERHPRLPVVRLRTPEQIEDWLTGPLARAAGSKS